MARTTAKGRRHPVRLCYLLGMCSIAMEYGADEDEVDRSLPAPRHRGDGHAHGGGGSRGRGVFGCAEAAQPSRRFIFTGTLTPGRPGASGRSAPHRPTPAEADAFVFLVSASDKLDNARAFLADLRRIGVKVVGHLQRLAQRAPAPALLEPGRGLPRQPRPRRRIDHKVRSVCRRDRAIRRRTFPAATGTSGRSSDGSDMELLEGVPIHEPAMSIALPNYGGTSSTNYEAHERDGNARALEGWASARPR